MAETTATYRRQSALAYARSFWRRAASDNFIAIGPSPFYRPAPAGTVFKQVINDGNFTEEYALLPDGSKIPWSDLDDCTHFVSCCLGSPPGETSGGGLPIRRDFRDIYGRLSAQRLFDDLVGDNLIELITEKADHAAATRGLARLQAGDLIFYWNEARGRYGHSALYLADPKRRIACHTYCRCDQTDEYDQAWDSVGLRQYTLAKVR